MSNDLQPNARDTIALVARTGVSLVPFAGPLLAEAINLIPGLRDERIVEYIEKLGARVDAMEEAAAKAAMANPHKLDLIERGGLQAARALSSERIDRIVEVVERGLKAVESEIIRRKRLLELLGEIDDDELAMLSAYGKAYVTHDWSVFGELNRPEPLMMGDGDENGKALALLEQNELFELGSRHLIRLGLLARRYTSPKKGQLPEFDYKTGGLKGRVDISFLGRMLLAEIGVDFAEGLGTARQPVG